VRARPGCSVTRRRQRRQETGSGTLLVLASALLVFSAALAAALWAALSAAHHRAVAAADLAALSAARAMQLGREEPCRVAERIAYEHQATLLGCHVDGDTVLVTAGVQLRLGAVGSPYAWAVARAGPVTG